MSGSMPRLVEVKDEVRRAVRVVTGEFANGQILNQEGLDDPLSLSGPIISRIVEQLDKEKLSFYYEPIVSVLPELVEEDRSFQNNGNSFLRIKRGFNNKIEKIFWQNMPEKNIEEKKLNLYDHIPP